MTSDNPLGILYYANDSSGRGGIGFTPFLDQVASTHLSEWTEILSEIISKGQSPLALRMCRQSEFLDAIAGLYKM